MLLYASTIFLSAFLLFLVQPTIAKQILPWFGGSAAVWATCMVFFQMTLLAGYAYADLTTRRLAPRRQAVIHGVLLVLSLLLLPIIPDAAWKPQGDENPSWLILGLLSATIGLPYLLLSTTTPLVQAWFARRYQHAIPYRLFALSNLASLLALLAYPVAIEPWVTVRAQSIGWSSAYGVFAALCLWAAFRSAGAGAPVEQKPAGESAGARPGIGQRIEWLVLAAMGSFMLLAVTNHVCQNVASVPFLWIVPLAIYLASFIFCFDHPRWYQRWVFLPLAAVLLPAMAWQSDSLELQQVVPLFAGGLFASCMCCHGELARSKPPPEFLTTYYLMISIGGAAGGLLVGLGAPYLLPAFFETGIGLVACAMVLAYRAWRLRWWAGVLSLIVIGATAWLAGRAAYDEVADARVLRRNFYGAIRTSDSGTPAQFRYLMHGAIVHGGQLLDLERRFEPSCYFGAGSGFGRLFASLPPAPRKVGVIGLGAGSIAAYARPGDEFRFYEINPQVIELARREFTFLTASAAKMEVVLGDGRLSLEREPPQQFDVLAMDAFSGDAIPLHLLTREAMAIYLKHLKPGGALAFQATNRFVGIAPVVARLAAEHGMTAVLISDWPEESDEDSYWLYETDQIIVTANQALLDAPRIREEGEKLRPPAGFPVWTDDFNNLLRVLKF